MMTIAQRLQDERVKRALTQAELAEKLDTIPITVSRWERGVTIPTFYYRRKLCDVYKMQLEELFPESANSLENEELIIPGSSPSMNANIFCCNGALKNTNDFFGRVRERLQLLTRVGSGQSVSIVGPRRIGKTWLLNYLRLKAPEEWGNQVQIGFVDATRPTCDSTLGFLQEALLQLHLPLPTEATIRSYLRAFDAGIQELQRKEIVAVLCIDEFEKLCQQSDFQLELLENLRALTHINLALVISTRSSLNKIIAAHVQDWDDTTSPFFNVFQQINIKPFTRQEAQSLVDAKAQQAQLTIQERERIMQYGKLKTADSWPPVKLQLAGALLYNDKVASQELPDLYRPTDPFYWQEFEQQVEEGYQEIASSYS